MNNALQEYARQSGCTLDEERRAVYGNLRGVNVILTEQTNQQINLKFTMSSERKIDNRQQITDFLNILKSGNPAITYYDVSNYKIIVHIKAYKTNESEIITKTADKIADFLKTLELKNCCEYCGETTDVGVTSVNGNVEVLCNSCLNKLKDNVKEQPKGNLPLGVLGALLGSLIGVAAWIGIYQLGFIAGIAGFLMFYCAVKGYQKLGKRNDMTGVVISVIISVIMLAVAELSCVLIVILKEYGGYGYSLMDCISLLPDFFAIPEVLKEVLKEIGMGYFLMALATVSSVKQCMKQTARKAEAVRL